jgi:hypothetical protein
LPASQAKPTFDLIMRITFSGVEFGQSFVDSGQKHESFDGM